MVRQTEDLAHNQRRTCSFAGSKWFRLKSEPVGATVDASHLNMRANNANFNICLDVQLTTHQPPMPNSSHASAWSHRYIGREGDKRKLPLLDSKRNRFQNLWKHFLVQDQRISIWVNFKFKLKHEILNMFLCIFQVNVDDSSNVMHSENSELSYVYENGADSSIATNSDIQNLWYVYENGADSSTVMHSEI